MLHSSVYVFVLNVVILIFHTHILSNTMVTLYVIQLHFKRERASRRTHHSLLFPSHYIGINHLLLLVCGVTYIRPSKPFY